MHQRERGVLARRRAALVQQQPQRGLEGERAEARKQRGGARDGLEVSKVALQPVEARGRERARLRPAERGGRQAQHLADGGPREARERDREQAREAARAAAARRAGGCLLSGRGGAPENTG